MRIQTFIALIIGIHVFACTNPFVTENSSAETDNIIAAFEEQIAEDVDQDNIGSISVSVFSSNQIILTKAFGKADHDKKIFADTNTIYRAASISKPITAFLMMLLVQNGTIDLNEPVHKYFPEITKLQHNGLLDAKNINFKHLASHTSGIEEEPQMPDASTGPTSEWENKLIRSIPTTRMNSIPGSKFSYSNIGYAILGLAISRAAKKPFIDLVHEMVFEPLNMTSSCFIIPKVQEDKLAAGYRWHAFNGIIDAEKAKAEHKGRGYKVPNGGIYTTPTDLARFLMAQCGDTHILSKKYLEMIQTIQTPESNDYGYGLGFYIRNNDKGIKMVEHDGGVAGYNAMMVFNPETKIGVIMMRNYDFGLTNILLKPRTLLRQLANQRLKKVR